MAENQQNSSQNIPEIINYKCPNCGAPMTYSIEEQKWICHFCDSTFTKAELSEIDASEGRQQPEVASWEATPFNEEEMTAYTCPDCGGKVLADHNTVATFCPYCHNPSVIASRLQGEHRPARIIPFKIPKAQVLDELKTLTKKKPLLPNFFKEAVDNGEITGLYAPYWLFSSDITGEMLAEGRRITMWSDSHYDYVKTDIYHVNRQGVVPFRLIPVDASVRLDDRLMDAIEPYDYSSMTDFSMEYLSGHLAENFDVNAEDSLKRYTQRANEAVQQVLTSTVRGYNSIRVLNMYTSSQGLDNLYVMLPVWTISVKYNDDTYAFAMNAQTGKSAGKLPISGKKSAIWFISMFAVFSIIAFAILFLTGGYI